MSADDTKKVLVLVAPGVEEMEAIISVDVLRRAGAQVTVASITADKITKCSRDVVIVADLLFDDVSSQNFDVVVLPGGLGAANSFSSNPQVGDLLRRFVSEDRIIAAICASPTALAAHKIYPGKAVTSHPSMKDKFAGYDYKEDKVVVDGKLVTSRGPGTSFDFALAIVKELFGQEKADATKGSLCL